MYLWLEWKALTAATQLFWNHAIRQLEPRPGIHLADCAVGEYTDVGDVTLSIVVDGICRNRGKTSTLMFSKILTQVASLAYHVCRSKTILVYDLSTRPCFDLSLENGKPPSC